MIAQLYVYTKMYWIVWGFFTDILLLFNYSCMHFIATPHCPPHPNSPPSLDSTLPVGFVHVSFIVVPVIPSSHCPPPRSHLAIVRLFLTSMSLVIFCSLFFVVDYVPVKGEIIWYLSLTIWLISLIIMLSTSIHAVTNGTSSSFLSAA